MFSLPLVLTLKVIFKIQMVITSHFLHLSFIISGERISVSVYIYIYILSVTANIGTEDPVTLHMITITIQKISFAY